jgi:cysteine-rich repeat protein
MRKMNEGRKFFGFVIVILVFSIVLYFTGFSNYENTKLQPTSVKIAYIGNSLTHFNQIYDKVEGFFDAAGIGLTWDAETPGGKNLAYHNGNSATTSMIENGDFEYIILQDQSAGACFSDWETSSSKIRANAIALSNKIHDAGAKSVMYETYAYANSFPSDLCSNKEEMQDQILYVYSSIADELDGLMAPVGEGFRYAYANYDMNLHADKLHPSPEGAYLAAAVFFGFFTGESPVGNSYRPSGISESEAEQLQTAAEWALTEYAEYTIYGAVIVEPVCGNNITEEGEECDLGQDVVGDGCDSECKIVDIGGENNETNVADINDTDLNITEENNDTEENVTVENNETEVNEIIEEENTPAPNPIVIESDDEIDEIEEGKKTKEGLSTTVILLIVGVAVLFLLVVAGIIFVVLQKKNIETY